MKKNNVIGKARLQNKTPLNAFDLSHRELFTSSLGFLSPLHCMELMPKDSVQLSPSWFTRAQTLVSNSYGRFIENVQTFFVPYSALMKNIQYRFISSSVSSASDFSENRSADSLTGSSKLNTKLPHMDLGEYYLAIMYFEALAFFLYQSYKKIGASFVDSPQVTMKTNPFTFTGQLRSVNMARLAQSLGYGDFDWILGDYLPDYMMTSSDTDKIPLRESDAGFDIDLIDEFGVTQNIKIHPMTEDAFTRVLTWIYARYNDGCSVSPLRFFAYQFVYNNFYRNDTWQPYESHTCNLDFWKDSDLDGDILHGYVTSISNAIGKFQEFSESPTTFSKFVALVNTYSISLFEKNNFMDLRVSNLPLDAVNGVLPNPQYGTDGAIANVVGKDSLSTLNKTLSLSATDKSHVSVTNGTDTTTLGVSEFEMRRSRALQKFLEISQSHDSNYVEQIKAHFGIDTKDDPYKAYFIGGSSATMQVDTQINQNLADDNAILGGIASAQGSYNCRYSSDTYGVLITLYRIIPVLDYKVSGLCDQILTVDSTDLPLPEFNDLGMTSRSYINLFGLSKSVATSARKTYGYAARFFDYKTARDTYRGDFCYNLANKVMSQNNLLFSWRVPQDKTISALLYARPQMADSIFVNTNHETVHDDQFYTNCNIGCTAVRPLSVHGLPYAN